MQFDHELASGDRYTVLNGTAKVTYLEGQVPFNKSVDWSNYLSIDKEIAVKSEERLSDVSSLALEVVHAAIQVS